MIDYGYCQSEICWGDAYIVEADIRKVLQGIKAVGGLRVRMGVQVGSVADLDRAVNLAVQYGLKPLLVIINNPAFGYDGSVAGYAKMCKTIALRYGPAGTNQVAEYELFNEANSTLNAPAVATGTAFAEWLKAGYTAIKSVHSSSTVIAGGTIPAPDTWVPFIGSAVNPLTWYQQIYAAGAQNYMDALGFHFYCDTAPTPSIPQWKYLTDLRALMVAQGDGAKKVWVTEVGVGFPGPGVTSLSVERDWAKILIQAVEGYSWCGPFFVYQYHNSTNNPNDPNSVYGIVNYDYSPKSPYYEYALTIGGSASADTTQPSQVTGVTWSDVTSESATLTWNPSTDNVSVFSYRVYLNGVKAAEFSTTSGTLTGLIPGTSYAPTVTAVDAAGNESVPSVAISPFTTNAPTGGGLQAFYQYTFTGSTLPTTFTQLGLGFSVSGGVALPNTSSTDGEFWTVDPYTVAQQSSNHSGQISQATASANPDRAALTLCRAAPDGSQWVGALITGGGQADACKIFTYSGGVVILQAASDAAPLQPGELLQLTANGNVYTVTRITPDGVTTNPLSWTDLNGVYPGAANLRTGIGWWHRRVGGVNYPPPGITGQWKSSDLMAVVPSVSAGSDLWKLAITHQKDWGQVIATGLWESAL